MLRTSPLWNILTLCLIAHAGPALAQQSKPGDAPPKLETIEPAPPITTPALPPPKSARGAPKITEKKEGGRVTEVKVQAGPSSYTMKPNTPAGNAQVGDAQGGSTIRPPQWTVMEFGPGKKKTTAEAAENTVDAPPPQTVKPAK
jgi:hypothetical protein